VGEATRRGGVGTGAAEAARTIAMARGDATAAGAAVAKALAGDVSITWVTTAERLRASMGEPSLMERRWPKGAHAVPIRTASPASLVASGDAGAGLWNHTGPRRGSSSRVTHWAGFVPPPDHGVPLAPSPSCGEEPSSSLELAEGHRSDCQRRDATLRGVSGGASSLGGGGCCGPSEADVDVSGRRTNETDDIDPCDESADATRPIGDIGERGDSGWRERRCGPVCGGPAEVADAGTGKVDFGACVPSLAEPARRAVRNGKSPPSRAAAAAKYSYAVGVTLGRGGYTVCGRLAAEWLDVNATPGTTALPPLSCSLPPLPSSLEVAVSPSGGPVSASAMSRLSVVIVLLGAAEAADAARATDGVTTARKRVCRGAAIWRAELAGR